MNFIQKIKESPHYERLKKSVQYTYDRRQFIIISVCFGLIDLLFVPLGILAGETSADASFVMCLFLGIGLFGVWLYYLYHWLEIFLRMDRYIFCQVRLEHPHTQYRGGTYYTVEFTDRQGNTIKRDTSPMFSSDWEPYLEDYNNKTVLIGYNEEMDRLVVIGQV